MMRRIGSALAVGLLAVLVSVGLALPALAHNTLTGSDPADGSTLTTAPSAITLTFDQPVQNYQPVLTVTGPNGNRYTSGPPSVTGPEVSITLDGAGPAGRYIAAYRIVSADGHPVSGEISYTLAAAAAGTAEGVPQQDGARAAPTDAGSADDDSGLGIWLWIGIAVAVLLVIAAVVVILRRPADTDTDGDTG